MMRIQYRDTGLRDRVSGICELVCARVNRRAQRYFDTADDLCPANPSNELRAGDTIDRVARAFMLYLRYAEMVLNTLKKYGSEWAQNASKSVHNKRCMLVLQRLEAVSLAQPIPALISVQEFIS